MRMKQLRAGIAVLLLATPSVCATERLPEAMLGNWCWIEGGDEQNWNQQIFARFEAEANPETTTICNCTDWRGQPRQSLFCGQTQRHAGLRSVRVNEDTPDSGQRRC